MIVRLSHQDGLILSRKIVSVLHQDEGGIGKSIPDARKISRDPRDFPRAKPEGNLEGRGKSGGQRGWISQYLPSFGGARTISQHQFFYREWIRKSFPVDREGLTVLKSILPCWWWQIGLYNSESHHMTNSGNQTQATRVIRDRDRDLGIYNSLRKHQLPTFIQSEAYKAYHKE